MDGTSSVMQNIWTLIINWGGIQCLVIAAILSFDKRGNQLQRLLLAGIIFIVGIQSFNFLFEYFRWYLFFPHGIWLSPPLWFLVGPLLFFFSRVCINKEASTSIFDALHFIPFVIALLYIAPFYSLTAEQKIFQLEFFYENYTDGPDYFFYAFILSQLIYGAYAFTQFRQYFKSVGEEFAHTHLYQHRWILTILASFIGFWTLTLIYHLLLITDFAFFFTYDYVTYTFLTVAVQAFGISAIMFPNSFFVTPLSKTLKGEISYESSDIEVDAKRVLEFVETSKPFLNPELRIADLSKHLDLPPHKLSFLINRWTGKNFFEFVNGYRVEEVKRRLPDTKYAHLTLDAIARDCGFNSSASFYRVFKQQTGLTPKEYLKGIN